MGKQRPVFGVEMTGFGGALPRERFSNQMLIDHYGIDSTADWIYDHTGISYRHIVSEGENVVTLGAEAIKQALLDAGIEPPAQIDYLFVASSTSDTYRPIPGAHPGIHRVLGDEGYAITASDDRNLACTGFVNALEAGYKRFDSDGIDIAAVVGTEALSKKWDFRDQGLEVDRGTSIVLGDGGAGVILQRVEGSESGLHGWWQETDSTEEKLLYANSDEPVYMDGPRVLMRAIRVMTKIGDAALQHAEENSGITRENIDWVVPHQANIRIIEPAAEKLGFNKDQLIIDLDLHGNTSTASIPLALLRGVKEGKIKKGDNLLMPGFGGGMTYEALVVTV